MSIRIPFVNYQYAVSPSGSVRLDLPSAAAQKPANTAFVLGMWVRGPSSAFENTRVHTFMGRQGTNTSGNDGYFRYTSNSMNAIEGLVRSGSTQRFSASVTLSASAYDKPLLVLLVCNAAHSHLVVVEPDGTQLVGTDATNALYAVAMTSTPFLHRIGSGLTHGFYGTIADYFHIHGAFPESGGVPDPTLVAAIASGGQDIATLDAQLTGGVKQCWYRMRDEFDLADAFGLQSALTPQNIAVPTGHVLMGSGPLRPEALRPDMTHDCISNAIFATPGLTASGYADIKTEGGAYVGITPAAIQARLIKQDGTAHVGWTVVDAAPTGGRWAASTFPAVAAVASFLRVEYRAVDGGGTQIGAIVSSHGRRGVGKSLLTEHQSQGIHLYEFGSLALPDDIRFIISRQKGTTSAVGTTEEAVLTSACGNSIRAGLGMRQAAVEFNTMHPGLPIQIATVGESGQPLTEWQGGGAYINRWGYMKAHYGVVAPFQMVFYGHSAPIANTAATLASVVALLETDLGVPQKYILCPTARYATAGTGGNWNAVSEIRDGMRTWFEANRAKAYWGGSWSDIECDSGDTGPHPALTAGGQGRAGAQIMRACMMASRAIADEVWGLLSATAIGTTVELSFGPIN
jgi:hypothetical protein